MVIKITCLECHGAFQTVIPTESWNQYQDGIPADIAFYDVSENARNLVVSKLCPTCYKSEYES